MGVQLSTRATSLSAAALLLGAAVIAALSLRVVIDGAIPPQPPAFESIRPDPPKPLQEPKQTRPTQPVKEDVLPPISAPPAPVDGPPTPTEFAPAVAPPAPITITRPDWVRRPADLGKYYPRRAHDRGIEGAVQLECLVQVDGRLNCAVAAESPTGWEFGDAALKIARDHSMVPATRDGVPVEARYRMRVPFNLD